MNADWIGWVATAVFVGSYLCTRADALRKVQMVGAGVWIGSGVVVLPAPVVTANALVLGAAAWASRRSQLTSPGSSSDSR
jgi:acetyltransferase-like isoleucine patch superfamily enzyme